MPRPSLYLALIVSMLALAACDEDSTLTQPETVGDPSPAAPSFALASNTWTAKAPFPSVFGSVGMSVGVFPNSAGQSILYTFGGTGDDGGYGVGIQAYDVATNTWTSKGFDSRVYVYNTNGVGKIGSKLYFSGGYGQGDGGPDPTWGTYAYDPAANRLTRKADMPRATADGVTGVINGKLWVLPGTCSGTGWPFAGYCDHEPIRLLYRYDPVTNHWGARRACPHYHRNGAGGVLDGKFYVAGGSDDHGGFTANLDVYDPATDTWRTLAPLPTAGPAIGTVLGGRLFVIVSGSARHAYVYDRVANTWKPRATPTWPHAAIAQVNFGGQPHVLAVGGFHTGPYPPGDDIPNNSELFTR
jgi:N-acetylneuraminic acid mutarotase